ncbi:MFS general substrate transporter [Schizopora paradoxa]|uniref:MFS general substrate transporter n=1 Tax=Schizopora paradoxa TaxID=27342 RepID=A0A0H2S8B5_9AGAM|nr:MFS general substrate transporter [Schizopora paradoxa]
MTSGVEDTHPPPHTSTPRSDYFGGIHVEVPSEVLRRNEQLGDPVASPTTPSSGTTTVVASPAISRKGSSLTLDELSQISSPTFPWVRRRAACSFFVFFLCGWGDGVTGTVLPYFISSFHLSYMSSSTLFVASTAGFALGLLVFERICSFFGSLGLPSNNNHSPTRGRYFTLLLFSVTHACFFVLMGTSRSIVYLLLAYFVAAFSRVFLVGHTNAYIASIPRRPLGQLHAMWALGAFSAPFVCQTLLARGIHFQHFYLGSLVLSALNTTFISFVFRPTLAERSKEQDSVPTVEETEEKHVPNSPVDEKDVEANELASVPVCEKGSGSMRKVSRGGRKFTLRIALSCGYLWAYAFFVWVYCGSETNTQGYIVTYLMGVRNANPKTVGYVQSGFWGGMAISRFITGFVTPRLSFTQLKYTLHGLLAVALAMNLLILFVRSVVENAISAAVVGLVFGPMFPSALVLASDILPEEIHVISLNLLCGFGNLGSSMFPFITGTLANIKGPRVIIYVTSCQVVVLLFSWFFFPSRVPQSSRR